MVDVEKLIEEVRTFPVLYDQSNDKYRNPEYKEKIWKIIATNLQVRGGVEECKKKWTSVRDQLRRTIQKRKSKSGQAAFQNRKYKYEDVLEFLVPHLGDREGLINVPKLQDDEEDFEYELNDVNHEELPQEISQQLVEEERTVKDENISVTSRDASFRTWNKKKCAKPKVNKRKMAKELQESPLRQLITCILAEKKKRKKLASRPDPVDAFLGGIAPSLKSLNPVLFNEAKGRIFEVVQEMEMRQLQMNATDESHVMSSYVTYSSTSSSGSTTPTPHYAAADDRNSLFDIP